MEANFYFTEYDIDDTSMKDFFIHGVFVGQYRNDILANWALGACILVPEHRVKGLFYRHFGFKLNTSKDVERAIKVIKEKHNQTIMQWMEPIMLYETEHGMS